MKYLKQSLPLVFISLLSGVTTHAVAETSSSPIAGAYVGGGLGYGRMNGEDYTNTNGDLTKSRVSWKALAGVKLNSMLALEGQYIDFGAANRNSDRIQATGWTAGLVIDFMQNSKITPYGKVGALFWDTDNRFNGISRDEDGVDIALGLGARFMLTENLALRTEYERFAMDDTDIDNFSLALQFHF